MFLKQRIRRLAAGGGILALALAGMLGSQTAASADGFPVVPDQPGSLTIHKHVLDGQSTPGHPVGAPLGGVGFSIQQLGKSGGGGCTAVNLTTPQGWADVSAAIAAFPTSTPNPPAGFCLTGSNFSVTTDDVTGAVTQSGLKGLYLVTETSPGPHMISQPAAPFLVTVPLPVAGTPGTWDFTVDAYPKNVLGTFTPNKTVESANVDGAVVPGALVPWTISTPVPVAAFPYTAISITDTPATGHTFEAWTEARLNGTLLNGPSTPPADYTVSDATLTLTPEGRAKVNAIVTGAEATAATITVKLTTEVTGTTLGGLENHASVTLNGTTESTPTPQSNWGKLVITKHVAGNPNATLAGARFAVFPKTAAGCATDVMGTPVWTTPALPNPSTAQQEAVLWISNTAPGENVGSKVYCLKETQAPTGYVLDSTPREVTISSASAWVTDYAFPNTPVEGPQLPLTGSTGAMAFGLVGFGLIGAAGALLAVRRSRAAKR